MLRGSGYLLQIADAPPARPDTRRPTVTADRRPVAASGGSRVISSAPPLAATVERSGLGTRRPLAAVGLGTVGVLVIAVALVPFHATVPRPIPIVLLLLPVVAVGVVGGRLAAGAVTVEAVAVLATGFRPLGLLGVTLAEDIAALAVFVAVAVVLGSLVAHVVAADRHRIALGEARAVALEQVDRQRRTLLSSVSHDLRTPLASIRAVSTDLREGFAYDEHSSATNSWT